MSDLEDLAAAWRRGAKRRPAARISSAGDMAAVAAWVTALVFGVAFVIGLAFWVSRENGETVAAIDRMRGVPSEVRVYHISAPPTRPPDVSEESSTPRRLDPQVEDQHWTPTSGVHAGMEWVRGYTTRDGHYVAAHWRRRPGR
jgi:hypothetical protein